MGGELRPDKCMYTLHEMRPTGDGEWEYVQERIINKTQAMASETDTVTDGLWEANAAPEDHEQTEATITVPLIKGDAAVIKRLTAQESERSMDFFEHAKCVSLGVVCFRRLLWNRDECPQVAS